MAYDSEHSRYALTRWPSPIDGELMGEGDRYTTYNTVAFEVLKPSLDRAINRSFAISNGYEHPHADVQNTYRHGLHARRGSVVLMLDGSPLELNTHYTYNYSLRRFTLTSGISGNSRGRLGLLHTEYVPDKSEYLFEDIAENVKRRYGLMVKKTTSSFIYETIVQMRSGINSAWRFLKKAEPLWVGGPDNQYMGSDSLVKYLTPISATHINEIIVEIIALDDYLNLKFGETVVAELGEYVTTNSFADGTLIGNLMKAINDIEEILEYVRSDGTNDDLLDLT